MYLILLIIILIAIATYYHKLKNKYSWNSMKREFGELYGSVKCYDLNTHDEEQNFKYDELKMKYKEVFENEIGTPKMIKIEEDDCDKNDMKIIDYCRPLSHGYRTFKGLTIRIQTTPWKYSTHFDSYDQVIQVLYGQKIWLLFDLHNKFKTTKDELNFIKQICGKDIFEIESILKNKKGINCEIKVTKAGQSIYIPKGVYHVTQSSPNEGCIFMNIVTSHTDELLFHKFRELWPNWSRGIQK